MPTLRIRTNASQGSDVLIGDMGVTVPASAGFIDLSENEELQSVEESEDLRELVTDDAFGAGSSTLILVDVNAGPADVAQANAEAFLTTVALSDSGPYSVVLRDSNGLADFVTSSGTLTTNKMVFGDSPTKGVKVASEWTFDPATGRIDGVMNGAGYALTLRNNATSGEILQGINFNGNMTHDLNVNGTGDGIFRVFTNAGLSGLEHDSAYTRMGPGAETLEPTIPLLVSGVFGDDWVAKLVGGSNGVDTASGGLLIMAGEYENDIVLRVMDQDGTFNIWDLHADNGQLVIGDTFENAKGGPTGTDFVGGVDLRLGPGNEADFNTQFGLYRIGSERLNLAISAYDSAGLQTFTTTATTLVLNATNVLDTAGYSLASNEVTVTLAGRYEITWDVTLENQGSSSRSQADSWLEVDTVEVGGTRRTHYLRTSNYGATSSGTVILELTAGQVVRLRGQRVTGSGTCETQPNGTALNIKRLS